MKNTWIIFKREIVATLQNPGVYAVVGLFFFLMSSVATQQAAYYAQVSTGGIPGDPKDFTQLVIAGLFGVVSILYVFVVPIVTMRAFAEERRSGMFELLATWPIRDWELIAGKFLGLSAILLVMDALMGVYIVAFYMLPWPDPSAAIDAGVVVSCFAGLVLLSLAYTAFGLFASSLTENQIVAAIVSFIGLFFFWIIQTMGGDATTLFSQICEGLSIYLHFLNFARGAIAMTDIAYFLVFTALWLFLTARSLELRQWKV